MRYEDWRTARAEETAALYAAERERWLTSLGWDTAATWAFAEEGRRAGTLPGLIARGPDGRVAGWMFYSVERGATHIGFIDADRADVVRDLLDHALDSPESEYSKRYQTFLFPRNSAVVVALSRRRFALNPQLVLSHPAVATGLPDAIGPEQTWQDDDVTGLVRLLARAYAGTPVAQTFAPEGRIEEWVNYVGQLTRTLACGRFLPEATFVVPSGSPECPAAALLTTEISDRVWHIAQVAVDPVARRAGHATRLVRRVCAEAGRAGAREVTLVVDARNDAARALYAQLGFHELGSLLFAARGRMTRVVGAGSAVANGTTDR